MNTIRVLTSLVIITAVAIACATGAEVSKPQTITIDCSRQFQQIEGFGVTTETADWVGIRDQTIIDEKLSDHLSKDLRVSIVRVNVKPDLLSWRVKDWKDISHRDFKFTGDNIPYQQQTLTLAAKLYKVNPKIKVVAMVYSPPFWMKDTEFFLNGVVAEKYRKHFAKYIVEWIRFMEDKYSVPIYAISIHANNDRPAGRPYVGSSYKDNLGSRVADIKAVGEMFIAEKINTLLIGPGESIPASQLLLTEITKDADAKRYLKILALHDSKKETVARELTFLSKKLSELSNAPVWITQAYGEDFEWDNPKPEPSPVEKELEGDDFIDDLLGDGEVTIKPELTYAQKQKKRLEREKKKKRDLAKLKQADNPKAFSLAIKMHNALTYLNTQAYIYAYATGSASHDTMGFGAKSAALFGETNPSKKSSIFKHFCRFVRQGSYRVASTKADKDTILVSAFTHKENKTLTIVLINPLQTSTKINIAIKNSDSPTSMNIYRTTGEKGIDCKLLGKTNILQGMLKMTLPPRSITTIVNE